MKFRRFLTTFLLLLTFCFAQAQSYVQIGNGTANSSMPYTAWNYSWSKAIYSSVDLGDAKTIDKISFQSQNLDGAIANQTIYVKQTTSSTVSATYEEPFSAGYTEVFSGNINGVPGEWNEIVFTTSIDYNGSDNLIIYFHSEHVSSSYNNFYATEVSGDVIKVAGSDDAFPTSDGMSPYPNALPNIRFYYQSSGPGTPTNPEPAENTEYVDVETELNFDLDDVSTSYDVYFSSTESDVANMEASALVADDAAATGAGTYTVDPTPSGNLLDQKTTYYWMVVASDGSSTSSSPVWSFETQKVISTFPYNQDFEGGNDVVFTLMYQPEDSDWHWTEEGSLGSWNAVETNPQNGDSCAYISPYFLTQGEEYELRTPRIDLPENSQIKFYWFNGNELADGKVAGVDSCYFQGSVDGGITWENITSLSPSEEQDVYQQELIDLADFEGNNTYFRWVYKIVDENSNPKNVYLDNIEIKQITNDPEISLNPTGVDFGDICLGGMKKAHIAITNNNLANDLVIAGVSTIAGFTTTYTGTISGGETDTATVFFQPTAATSYSGSLTFEIDGNFTGNNELLVSGVGTEPLTSVYEYFDDVNSGELPSGWTSINDPENEFHFVAVEQGTSNEYNSAPNVLRMYNSDEYLYPLMAVLPGVTNFESNVLQFYAVKNVFEPLKLYVGIMDDPTNPASFEVVDTIMVNSEITQHTVEFDGSNTKPYIAFSHAMNDSLIASIRLDDVLWKNPDNTSVPEAAGNAYPVHENADIDIMNNMIFKWTNEGGEPTGYRLSLGTTTAANEIIDNVETGDTTAFVFDGALEYNTTYYWKVVAYNDNGDAQNTETWNFTTMEDPLVSSLPWSEDFNNYVEHNLPSDNFYYPLGWSLENNLTEYYCWDKIANNPNAPDNAHSDSIAMHIISFSFDEPLDDWLFSKPIQLEAGTTYEFSFWYKTADFAGEGTSEKLEVKWGSDNASLAMAETALFYDDNITVREWTLFTTEISPETTGEYYFGFHAFSDPLQWILFIDDMSITELSGANVTFNVTGDGEPLEGAMVTIDNNTHTTDADGTISVFLGEGIYSYEVTAENYSTVNESVTVENEDVTIDVSLTDIYQLDKSSYAVYPNPTNGQVNISGLNSFEVKVFNALGQKVYSGNYNGNSSISLERLPKGIYYLNLKSNNQTTTQRIVIE